MKPNDYSNITNSLDSASLYGKLEEVKPVEIR